MVHRISRGVIAAVAGLVAASSLTACSNDSGVHANSSGSSANAGSAGADSASGKALDTAYTGMTGTVPTEAVKKITKDVNAWVISCGEQSPSCATPTAAIVEAAKKLGWTTKVCDGQLSPTGWSSCVRQATSAKAKVIFPVGIDCASIQAPFEEAKKAGITTVGAGGADCNATGGSKLWATERLQLKDTTNEQYWKLNGKLQADWLIGKTGGKAKVLQLKFTDPIWGPWLAQGFTDEMKTCNDCKIVKTLEISNNDMVSNATSQKFSSALVQDPSINAIEVPVGGWMQSGISQAIQSSGRASKLQVVTGFGDASTMQLVRNGGYSLGVLGYASEWGAYGSVDEALRVLSGQAPVVEGDGFQMVDKTKNLPASGDYTGTTDFKTSYLKLWGVS